MALIEKRDLPLVDYPGMNRVHERELDYLNNLYDAIVSGEDDRKVDELLDEFLSDVKNHFSYEEDLMRKSHFFAYPCHSGEHERVLRELEDVKRRWRESRDREFLKKYFEETFKDWIVEHIQTMDTVTAQWLNRVMSGFLY